MNFVLYTKHCFALPTKFTSYPILYVLVSTPIFRKMLFYISSKDRTISVSLNGADSQHLMTLSGTDYLPPLGNYFVPAFLILAASALTDKRPL